MLARERLDVAFAKGVDDFFAARALDIAHVLHEREHGNLHQSCHMHGFFDDHAHQLLRRGDNHDAVHGDRLKHRQRNVSRSRGHVDEHHVHIAPEHIRPELLDGARNDRPAPDDRVGFVFEQQVHAHNLDARLAHHGVDALIGAFRAGMQTKRLRNRRAGDIRIQDGGAVTAPAHQNGEHGGDDGLANAALAADHADDSLHMRHDMRVFEHAGFFAAGAGGSATGTIVGAVFHMTWFSFILIF
ncbi:hypothetical protein SDC9_147044 [bioreactor metagenome]|uniref:Uncharacterized protein n=1 Tax=bioreactor metagenome TaxID=1076179 RepID=A0A645EEU2_9ZZZZ